MSPRSVARRRMIERSRRFRAGHRQARPSLYPGKPAKLKSAPDSLCQVTQAAPSAPRRLMITPLAKSAAPTPAGPAPKSP
jgi:hypothetical protein